MAKATTIFNAIKVNLKYANYGSFEKFVQASPESLQRLWGRTGVRAVARKARVTD